ncbi:biotin transporter BioY [Aestuariivirga sp.]|uniref:biotin transporter BioY n=1 Tax=Aestuariivirga sp. TaxID=2650926 RepID=UPI00391A6D66
MNGNLLSSVWPRSQALHKAVLVGLGVVLLTLASKVQVPFWPVPMTLQTLAVLLIGATAGARLGGATVLAWLALGAVGLPVFATGAGLAYMAGPTGGYLAGFLAAALLTGYLADMGDGRKLGSAFVMLLMGNVLIFALGTAWLAMLIGPKQAFAAGVLPFLPAEALKLALGTLLLASAWKRAKR